ncbi:glycosyltransferase [Vibrio sp. 10N.261.52.C11]|uniref:glycosyltransferase n=1 Tax=unclassified Vibrio TaxID=2614977 RepID=UPI00354B6F92
MKVLHVSYQDCSGGAHIAARRICEAQRNAGIDATMLVGSKGSSKIFVRDVSLKRKVYNMFANMLGQKIANFQKKSSNPILHSLNVFPSKLYHVINSSDCDVVNLHWINAEFMRIEDIAKINKPIVWTLHDMWPFSGAEHYDDLEHPERYVEGYSSGNRPKHYTGRDFDLALFKRKKKHYPKTMHIVSPSNWMRECASKSELLKNHIHSVIPNTLDINIFRPLDISYCRELLGFPKDKKLVLFGAFNSKDDPRKGFKFIRKAIDLLNEHESAEDIEFVIYGSEQMESEHFGKIKANYIGKFSDEVSLAAIYNAVDIFVAPSMQDNLPNTILEAQACGTPTVAFNIGGIPDMVNSESKGFLATPFEANEIAQGILQILKCPIDKTDVSREFIDGYFSEKVVCSSYISVYERVLNGKK